MVALRKLFAEAGCGTSVFEQPVPNSPPTLGCFTKATSDSEILVVAPVEYSAKSADEAMLRWGDLTMLPVLAQSLGPVLTRHRFVFVALGGKGDGEEGAAEYLKQLSPEQRKKIDAVVALDHLGRSLPVYDIRGVNAGQQIEVGSRRSSTFSHTEWRPDQMPLTRSIAPAAMALQLAVPTKVDDVAANLTKPFDREEIHAITFFSPDSVVTGEVPVLAGNYPIREARTKLDAKAYNGTYLFLCAYLLYLDRDLGRSLPAPSDQLAAATLAADASAEKKTAEASAAVPTSTAPPAATTAETKSQTSTAATPAADGSVVLASSGSLASSPVPQPAGTHAAQAENTPAGVPVFQTTTRLVQLDIVASDKNGRPIQDLRKEDFVVLQDGRPQPVHVFEAHIGTEPTAEKPEAAAAQSPEEAANTYSNLPAHASEQTKTIVLFDMMNTASQDQQLARNQLKKLAQTLPKGQPVALFALSERLVMIEPLTTDPQRIVLAIDHLLLQPSKVLTTEAERQQEIGDITNAAQQSTSGSSGSGSATASFTDAMIERQLLGYKTAEAFRIQQRVLFTLDAFAALARSLAGYPGRKNVVWLSGSFPGGILGDPTMGGDQWRTDQNYQEEVSRTTALLTESRVAVYPVDIRGIQTRGIEITTSGSQSSAFVGPNTVSVGQMSNDNGSNLLADQTIAFAQERETMTDVADQTGGRAFINTNDFAGAIARAMEDGSNYYTLAYTPDTKDDRAEYHRIQVKLDRPGVKLSYRRGYFSQPQTGTPQTGLAALRGALQPGMPPSTMLLFSASVKPPEAKSGVVEIQYSVNANDITLGDADQGAKHVVLDFIAVAFDKEGKEVTHASDTLDGKIPAAALDGTLRQGIPARQELDLKPGVYNVRIGVQDRTSQRIGTLEIPVLVPGGGTSR